MNKIVFIDDFFVEQLLGGGELNNDEVIKGLIVDNYEVIKLNSNLCTVDFLKQNIKYFFIIGNFIGLHKSCKDFLTDNCRYLIYEHDHKYLLTRNPAFYQNYIAPKEHIVNIDFYQKARAVLCQTSFHKKIILSNLSNVNVINLSGNMWSIKSLNLLERFSEKKKNDSCAVMDSNISHKNTEEAVLYCKYKNLQYNLVKSSIYEKFLEELTNNSKLVFFPKTPETLSRIAVESRMANMSVITNKNLGASYEDWFSLKGKPLIDLMMEKRNNIINTIKDCIK